MNFLFKIKEIITAFAVAFAVAFGLYKIGKNKREEEINFENEKAINNKLYEMLDQNNKISNLTDDELNNKLRRKEDIH